MRIPDKHSTPLPVRLAVAAVASKPMSDENLNLPYGPLNPKQMEQVGQMVDSKLEAAFSEQRQAVHDILVEPTDGAEPNPSLSYKQGQEVSNMVAYAQAEFVKELLMGLAAGTRERGAGKVADTFEAAAQSITIGKYLP